MQAKEDESSNDVGAPAASLSQSHTHDQVAKQNGAGDGTITVADNESVENKTNEDPAVSNAQIEAENLHEKQEVEVMDGEGGGEGGGDLDVPIEEVQTEKSEEIVEGVDERGGHSSAQGENLKHLFFSYIGEKPAKELLEEMLRFTMWDFGGQKEFYHMHHLFLTRFAIYVVTVNMELLLPKTNHEEKTEAIEYIRGWLNSIAMHAVDPIDGTIAPIIIVGTRKVTTI